MKKYIDGKACRLALFSSRCPKIGAKVGFPLWPNRIARKPSFSVNYEQGLPPPRPWKLALSPYMMQKKSPLSFIFWEIE